MSSYDNLIGIWWSLYLEVYYTITSPLHLHMQYRWCTHWCRYFLDCTASLSMYSKSGTYQWCSGIWKLRNAYDLTWVHPSCSCFPENIVALSIVWCQLWGLVWEWYTLHTQIYNDLSIPTIVMSGFGCAAYHRQLWLLQMCQYDIAQLETIQSLQIFFISWERVTIFGRNICHLCQWLTVPNHTW